VVQLAIESHHALVNLDPQRSRVDPEDLLDHVMNHLVRPTTNHHGRLSPGSRDLALSPTGSDGLGF
jgi:hypothetical protein